VETVEDVLLVGDRRARDVGVLEPQDERPADVAGEQEVVQGRAVPMWSGPVGLGAIRTRTSLDRAESVILEW
jgi:hypothetical protein